MQSIVTTRSLFISLAVVAGFVATPAFGYIETINDSAISAPQTGFVGINAIGWYYTPQQSYYLTGVYSTFDSLSGGPTQLLTVQVQTELPSNGGVVLQQGMFTITSSGGSLGASFAPLLLHAGQKYFVDYLNTNNVGINLGTWENDGNGNPQPSGGATTNLSAWYFDAGSGFTLDTNRFGVTTSGDHASGSEPILRFDGFLVPEPGAAVLAIFAGSSIGAIRRKRK